MTYKQIEASREARLWLGQVIIPAATAAAVILSNKEARDKIVETASNVKNNFKRKFNL